MPIRTNKSGERAGRTEPSPFPLIIVIDDDDAVRDSLKAVLESHHFKVVDFASGRRFLEFYGTSRQAACLILATQIADIAGTDLLRSLRAGDDFVPVILTTGQRNSALEAHSIALGAIALLDKPISPALLFGAIQRALSGP